jgi:membrane protein required for colicin V production
MVWLDVLIALVVLFEIWNGWRNGLVSQIGSILGILLGYAVASITNETMSSFLLPVTHDSILASKVLAFLLTFLAVFALILILSKIFEGFLKVFALDWVNRIAGAFFCLLRGLLLMSIVLSLVQSLDKKGRLLHSQTVEKSILYHPVRGFAPAIFPSMQLFHTSVEPNKVEPTKTIVR